MLRKKVGLGLINACFIFLPHLTNASALPGKTRKHKIASFQSNAVLQAIVESRCSKIDEYDNSRIWSGKVRCSLNMKLR